MDETSMDETPMDDEGSDALQRRASLRPSHQKALDRLARACWYLRPDVRVPINDSPDMYHALTAFGYGTFGHAAFARKMRIQRETEVSSLGANQDGIRSDRYIEVVRLLSGALEAMEEAGDMDDEGDGLVEVGKWFQVRWMDWEGWGGSSAASSEEEDEGMGESGSEEEGEA